MRYLVLLILLAAAPAWAQPARPTCAATPGRCDKELLLLKDEVEQRRQALAALLEANEQLEQRAAQAEARVKAREAAAPPAEPERTP